MKSVKKIIFNDIIEALGKKTYGVRYMRQTQKHHKFISKIYDETNSKLFTFMWTQYLMMIRSQVSKDNTDEFSS